MLETIYDEFKFVNKSKIEPAIITVLNNIVKNHESDIDKKLAAIYYYKLLN